MNQILEFLGSCRAISDQIKVIDALESASYLRNLSAIQRSIGGVVQPSSVSEVVEIVRLANKYSVSLYPISRGRNWGFGSRLPVRDNAVIVDLGDMKKIRHYDSKSGYVVIEPGVTQKQLADFLRTQRSDYFLDVTGSSSESSVVGNALERGIAYNSLRPNSVTNLEVVLGTGAILKTGFLHFENATCADRYRSGIGPDLSGLMFQSNYGIVTAITYRLSKKASFELSFSLNFSDEHLPSFLDGIEKIKKKFHWDSIIHIGNRKRGKFTVEPYARWLARTRPELGINESEIEELLDEELLKKEWTAIGGIHGSKALVSEIAKEIRKNFKNMGELRILSQSRISQARTLLSIFRFAGLKKKRFLLELIVPFQGLSQGIPTDASIYSFLERKRDLNQYDAVDLSEGVDKSDIGFLYCAPLCRLCGSEGEKMIRIIQKNCRSFGFEPEVTLNTIQDDLLEAVVSISFDQRNLEISKNAQLCTRSLIQSLIAAGFLPYRLGIDQMDLMIDPHDEFWKVVYELKKILDPRQVIAPGRYNLG